MKETNVALSIKHANCPHLTARPCDTSCFLRTDGSRACTRPPAPPISFDAADLPPFRGVPIRTAEGPGTAPLLTHGQWREAYDQAVSQNEQITKRRPRIIFMIECQGWPVVALDDGTVWTIHADEKFHQVEFARENDDGA